jgi:hypothetical protein
MNFRPRLLLLVLVALLTALFAAGCGGDDASSVDADTSVDELLQKTFTGEKNVDSGKLDLALNIDVQGGDSQVQGPISLRLSGPFQTRGAGSPSSPSMPPSRAPARLSRPG